MINSSDILCFIKDKSVDLPKEELERIIEEELNKPENEMDADLIEYCLDALNELESNDTVEIKAERTSDLKDNKITKPFKKVFAIAAAVAILTVGSLSVFAAVSDVSILDGLVELYNKYIVVRFDKSDDKADDYELLGTELAEELKENGIYPVLLPEALLNDETRIKEIEYQHTEFINSIYEPPSIDVDDGGGISPQGGVVALVVLAIAGGVAIAATVVGAYSITVGINLNYIATVNHWLTEEV